MSKVNFVNEFNLFMRYARDNCLSLRERALWFALFYIANDRASYNEQTQEYEWPDDFIQISNGEMNLHSCLDKRGIETLRNGLKQRGLIDFQPGLKNKRNPAYKINYLSIQVGCKNVPNNTPKDVPNNVPNDAPKHVPKHVPSNTPTPAPNSAETEAVLGTKMHPTVSPYPKDKYINNNNRYGVGSSANASQGTYRSGRNGGNKASTDDIGFVDLSQEGIECDDFVALPWEERV